MDKIQTAPAPAENGEGKSLTLTADFGQVYVKIRNGQLMSTVKAKMNLFERMGHIYNQQGKWRPTAAGYRYMNQVASISIVTPQSVIVDGRPVPNPNIERNPRTRTPEAVNLRKMGIGFSPAGNIVVIDKTMYFSLKTYFIQSIQAKMKKSPGCAVYGVKNAMPKEEGSWVFYEVESPLGIWINYKAPAIIDCLEEHTQRQKFAERIATTIIERNILKDHPALAISQVYAKGASPDATAYVTVYGWQNDLEPRNLTEIMSQVEAGDETRDLEVKQGVITEVDEGEEKEAREEAAEVDESKTPAAADQPPDDFFLKQQEELKKKGKA